MQGNEEGLGNHGEGLSATSVPYLQVVELHTDFTLGLLHADSHDE